MTDAEIEKMRKEAEEHAEEDKKKAETAKLRNESESLVFQTEKTLKDVGDKVSEDIKKPINEKLADLKKLLEEKDLAKIDHDKLKAAHDTLSDEIQKVGTELYKAASEKAEAEKKTSGEGEKKDDGKDGPVEGEVVDEKK
jgi:molecular chaperone DnaK